ncbi:MAG: hypothetical protein AAF465_03805 [Pseudomonadota bacterium]
MSDDDNRQASGPQRKRGVQASRTRLSQALTAAGFRTQSALADHMADREHLDAAPKDLVSRAFRELPVDPLSLERIASALNVEVHTLYKTADEADLVPPIDTRTPTSPDTESDIAATAHPVGRTGWIGALLIALAILAAIVWWPAPKPGVNATDTIADTPSNTEQTPPLSNDRRVIPLSRGPLSIVVSTIENDVDNRLSEAIRNTLTDAFHVASITATAATQSDAPEALAQELRADLVVYGDIVSVGSLSGIRLYGVIDDQRQPLWAETLPSAQLETQTSAIAARLSTAINSMIAGRAAPYFPAASAQDDYLQGHRYLERPPSELDIKRAQTRFSSALRQDPNFARAHAGLCSALLEEFWMGDEERAMDDAARTCGRALALAPDDSAVRAAHAYFLRRSGQSEQSIELYKNIVDADPLNAVALEGLASALLDHFRKLGEPSSLSDAITAAEQSVKANPNAWRPYNTLINLNWFAGNIPGAIAAAEKSIEFDENELVLVNLGTMYLCMGQVEQSRQTYERAIEMAPDSYVGIEFLGQAMYFLGEFERSATLRRDAIESIAEGEPEIHEMWGNLGDSYRQVGNASGAIGAYLQASKIAERDHLRGNSAIADRASRAYYYVMLRQLDQDTVPDAVYNRIIDELVEIDNEVSESSALRRLAQTWLVLGERSKARATLARVTKTCPGYASMPDLAGLSSAP